jgi:5-(carboxyamino)imidazole ribonucleotide synthase
LLKFLRHKFVEKVEAVPSFPHLSILSKKSKFVKNFKIKTPIKTLGIIGGGQLGRMACFAAQAMGFRTVIFTDQKNSPASSVTNQTILAKYSDKKALKKFADLVDVATFEFENIPFETVDYVASQVSFFPRAEVLKITQHRILEKNFLNSIGVKTADYAEIFSLEDLQKNLKKFGKAILKTATMGYDGKGQFVLTKVAEVQKVWSQLVDGPRNKCGVTSWECGVQN